MGLILFTEQLEPQIIAPRPVQQGSHLKRRLEMYLLRKLNLDSRTESSLWPGYPEHT